MSGQHNAATKTLERALDQTDDQDAIFHIRQAMQYLSREELEE